MIDYTETKTIEIEGNSYTIGKVSKKVFAMFSAALAECGDSLERQIAAGYNYLPFFLRSATVDGQKMPEPISETDGRTTVKHADYEWVADNIEGTAIIQLFRDAFEFNTVDPELKKK